MGELGTVLQWWVTAGNPWVFLALERNTSGGRSIKAAGCPGPFSLLPQCKSDAERGTKDGSFSTYNGSGPQGSPGIVC